MVKKFTPIILLLVLTTLVVSCASKEKKRARFLDKGKALYEQGDYVRARLELKNALQIDPKFADAYCLLGKVELKDKNFKQAFGYFSQAIKLDEGLMAARLELGRLFLAGKALERAAEQYELILARQPDDPDALQLKAAVLMAEKKPDVARPILTRLLEEGHTASEVYFMLTSIAMAEKDTLTAETWLKNGITANPDAIMLRRILAGLYAGTQRIQPAVDQLQKIIELEPENPGHTFALADFYWRFDQKNKAEKLLADLLDAGGENNEKNRIDAARFYVNRKQIDRAIQLLETGVQSSPKSWQTRLALSQLLLSQKKMDDAVKTLEVYLPLEKDTALPGVIRTKNALAAIFLKTGETDRAAQLTDEVLTENAKNVEAHFNKGQLALLEGDGTAAIPEFRTVVNEKPDFLPGYLHLARAHLQNKEMELATDTLIKAVKIDPKSREARTSLARLYTAKKDFKAAIAQFKEMRQFYPDDNRIPAAIGEIHEFAGNPEQAEKVYRSIISKTPESALGYLRLSRFYARRKKMGKADATLRQGLEKNPKSAEIFSSLVKLYAVEKRFDDAIGRCQAQIAKHPEDALCHNLLGGVYAMKKDYARAENAVKKAISLNPEWQAPHNALVRLYLAQGQKDKAVADLEKTLTANPKNFRAYMTLGFLYETSQAHDKARRVYEKALEVNPNLWAAANNLAFLLSEEAQSEADFDRALSLAGRALKARPDDPMVLDTMGWAYFKKGDNQRALGIMEKAIAKAPESPVLNYHLGMVLAKVNRPEEALEKLEKALATENDFSGRKEAEAKLATLEKDA